MKLFLLTISLIVLGCVTVLPGTRTLPVVTENKESFTSACPLVKKIGEPFTNIDKYNLGVAQKRCPQLYLASPCLKIFAKTAAYTYRAICGSANSAGNEQFFDLKDRNK